MPNDNVVYVSLDIDEEHKVFTVSHDWTSKDGKAHFEGCYICNTIKDALMLAGLIMDKYNGKGYETKQVISC